MPRSSLLLALACVAVVACTQGMTSREHGIELRIVEDRFEAWVQAQNNGWRDSLEAMYYHGPEVQVLWADGRRTEGWEETQQAMNDRRDMMQYMNIAVTDAHSEVLSASVAMSVFKHSTDIVQTTMQRRPVVSGQGMLVWVRDPADGFWKIHSQQISVSSASLN